MTGSTFGAADSSASSAIERANRLSALRAAGLYADLAKALEADAIAFGSDAHARQRLTGELAEIYTYQLLDIERAIHLDEQAAKDVATDAGSPTFIPRVDVANQRILSDSRYVDDYVRVQSSVVSERRERRLEINRALLNGQPVRAKRRFETLFLQKHIGAVRDDIASTLPNSAERRKILSRLVRAELELWRIRPDTRLSAQEHFNSGALSADSVDLAEIDYLSLAEFLLAASRQTRRIELAEMALEVVYRPYTQLKDSAARWRYNRIINDSIGDIADLCFQAGRWPDMLYYLSLNKSRLILEERLAVSALGKVTDSLSAAVAGDGIPRTAAGLPDRTWFAKRLKETPIFLDFHLASKVAAGSLRPAATRSAATELLRTRDFGLESAGEPVEQYTDAALYITRVEDGRVVAVRRIVGSELADLRRQTDETYQAMSLPGQGHIQNQSPVILSQLRGDLGIGKTIVVSPDKWLAKLPFDAVLDRPTTRAINLFTAGADPKLHRVQIAGFFNPTLDLPGAEREADAIAAVWPQLRAFKREQATVAALAGVGEANIVHLSMHGRFDANDPQRSRLYFAGARRPPPAADDPAALYAKDMARKGALQRRDLIFAAACQTGLSGAQSTNDAELLGILRPLATAGNRFVILSLWKVDDDATQRFVAAFYAHLARYRNVELAFREAQSDLRKTFPQPYYWSAFYLSHSS